MKPVPMKLGRPEQPQRAGVRQAGRLPSLSALRAFEAAARHLSCKRAADELHLTAGAISYQVRQLEAELGVSLFVRLPRTLELTATGEQLLASVGPAFDLIARGTDEARAEGRRRLRVGLLPSFATHWLLSRLPRFEETHPDIEVLFEPNLAHADFASDKVELAIRYGAGRWPGLEARLFMTEHLAPVCAPSLLRKGPPIACRRTYRPTPPCCPTRASLSNGSPGLPPTVLAGARAGPGCCTTTTSCSRRRSRGRASPWDGAG